ncbi:MAG: hypothetical protein VX341_12180 [Bdellovibrionota bacterium]|nr:hypothetical protein [Bdellovibrionota bacterium]
MKVLIAGIFVFIILGYITVRQSQLSSSRIKNLAGDEKIDLKKKTSKKKLKKLDVVKGKINKELSRYKELEKSLEELEKSLKEDTSLSIEAVNEKRSRIVEIKKSLGLKIDPEDKIRSYILAYADYKGESVSDLVDLNEDEQNELFDPVGGKVWLNKYFIQTILRGENTTPASPSEIKLNIQRRKLLSLRKKLKKSSSVIEDIKSKKSKTVDLNNVKVNEQKDVETKNIGEEEYE